MKVKPHRSILRKVLFCVVLLFVIFNLLSGIHAYRLSHYDENAKSIEKNYNISFFDKIKMGIFSVSLPKPKSQKKPEQLYQEVAIPTESNQHLSAWSIKTDSISKGLIIMFHGYMSEKSEMLDRTQPLLNLGFDILLVDFKGSGNSGGNQVTLGYKESEDVKSAYDYAINVLHEKNIYLLGFSMGAAAITKAQHDYRMNVKGVILEACYGNMKDAVGIRIERTGLPRFPLVYFMTFYFGALNGFNAFGFEPEEFVKEVQVPTLIIAGGKDPNIPIEETQRIFDSIGSKNKKLKIFEESHHESFLIKHPDEWKKITTDFLITN